MRVQMLLITPQISVPLSSQLVGFFINNPFTWPVSLLLAASVLSAFTTTSLAEQIEIKSFFSKALEKEVPYTVVSPSSELPSKGWPTLFLLHGRGRSHLSLIEDSRLHTDLLNQPYLIVLPMGFDGWYVDSPTNSAAKYGSALEELESVIASSYPVQKKRESRAIIGWSMGGFGALYHATHRPRQYSFTASVIGLIDFPREKGFPVAQHYDVPDITFGRDPDVWQRFNPRFNIAALEKTRVFLVIGEQAFDRTMNDNFLRDARKASINIEAIRLPHAHTFQAVKEGLPIVLGKVREHFSNIEGFQSP